MLIFSNKCSNVDYCGVIIVVAVLVAVGECEHNFILRQELKIICFFQAHNFHSYHSKIYAVITVGE